jgi:hypothetical protein
MTQIAIGARTSPPSEIAIATGIMPTGLVYTTDFSVGLYILEFNG